MKILTIEDSPEIVETISICLQTRWPEAEVFYSAEGRGGIDLLKTDHFNLVTLDINLPDMDGFSILKEIRSFSPIPIIMLSVRASDADHKLAFELGANDYIKKPFNATTLITKVNALLSRNAASDSTPAHLIELKK